MGITHTPLTKHIDYTERQISVQLGNHSFITMNESLYLIRNVTLRISKLSLLMKFKKKFTEDSSLVDDSKYK